LARDPDAALYGADKSGRQVVVLLTIGAPVLKGSKLTFAAYHLPATQNPLLRGGVVDAVVLGVRAVRPCLWYCLFTRHCTVQFVLL
jgi:hypothetical protein